MNIELNLPIFSLLNYLRAVFLYRDSIKSEYTFVVDLPSNDDTLLDTMILHVSALPLSAYLCILAINTLPLLCLPSKYKRLDLTIDFLLWPGWKKRPFLWPRPTLHLLLCYLDLIVMHSIRAYVWAPQMYIQGYYARIAVLYL